jgi:tetratricopeptide (TPR) repeat protein
LNQKKLNFKKKLLPMFRTLRAIFLLIAVSCQLNAQTSTFINSGNENLQKKNYKEALDYFNKALKENPTNIQALCGSANAQSGLGNAQEAQTLAEAALRQAPKSDYANYTKAEVLLAAKDYAGALNFYNTTIDINTSYFPAYVGKSKAYNLLGDVKEAYKVLDNAIAAFPSSTELFLARGLLNNSKEKYSKALDDFDKAIKLNPVTNTFALYFNRGISYTSLEEYEPAVADFTKAAEIDPSNANAFYSRGLANYQLGNYDVSVKDFLKADELNPNNPATFYNLGMAYNKLEDRDNACLYFHKSCGMKNNNACKMIIMVCSGK